MENTQIFAGPKIYLIQGYIRKFYMEVNIDMEKAGKYFFILFFFFTYLVWVLVGWRISYGIKGPANICVLIIIEIELFLMIDYPIHLPVTPIPKMSLHFIRTYPLTPQPLPRL